MIRSMTGFGRAEVSDESCRITVEMKAVNHRYLDINLKMPKKLSFFEASIRNVLKEYISRGKIDIFVNYEDFTENNYCLRYNRDIAASYIRYANEMSEEFSLENDMRVSVLSRYPEVLTLEEQDIDENEIWSKLERALRSASEQFVNSRIMEGENLKKDLIEKLDKMLDELVNYDKYYGNKE